MARKPRIEYAGAIYHLMRVKKVIAWLVRRKTAEKNEWISSWLDGGNASNLLRYVAEVESYKGGEFHELKTIKS